MWSSIKLLEWKTEHIKDLFNYVQNKREKGWLALPLLAKVICLGINVHFAFEFEVNSKHSVGKMTFN